jgi:hypothetical protein
MSDDPMAIFGNTTKGGHRGRSEQKFACPKQGCGRYIVKYPCPFCGYEPGTLDRESAPGPVPLELLWHTVDGEIILDWSFPCDGCGKEAKRFQVREYA